MVEEDEEDEHAFMTQEELEEAQERFWARIADPHGGDGIILKEDPKVLDTCDLKGVADYINRGSGYGDEKRKVVVMVGAGEWDVVKSLWRFNLVSRYKYVRRDSGF